MEDNTTSLQGLRYKRSKGKFAFKFVNGDWITSTTTNEQAFRRQDMRSKGRYTGYKANRVAGMSDIMTYMEAVEAQHKLNPDRSGITKLAASYGTDVKGLDVCLGLLQTSGVNGFVRFDNSHIELLGANG